MLGRLLIGIVKGLIVGCLLGFGLVKLGQVTPGAILAYPAAALTGVVVGLIAGKPIWAKDAKIEAGTKAFVGALLAIGLMAAARTWLVTVPLPFSVGALAPGNSDALTLGGFAMSALAGIAALLGGFYEADNDPSSEEAAPAGEKERGAKKGQRIAPALKSHGEEEEDLEAEADRKHSKK
jgi:hypothetical protein